MTPPQETHRCEACPMEFRDLFALAHNAVGAFFRGDSPNRVHRKMAELKLGVENYQKLVDEHFDALKEEAR